ncbi:MAG TPA: hypothetical protein VK518_17250, partial [Puia sp.]|nr:hypothetical protein [Puia sp.]
MNKKPRDTANKGMIELTVSKITGRHYSFAIASTRCWNSIDNIEADSAIGFCQLMPENGDNGFFDWYLSERPFNQFFRSYED